MSFNSEHMFDEEMSRGIDPQRFSNKTYAAEWICFGKSVLEKRHPSRPITIMEAKEIAYSLGIHDVKIIPTLRSDTRRSTYTYGTKTIRLSPGHGVYILLHELAHHTCGQRGHTKLFRGHYLRLVRTQLGDEWADRLKKSFMLVGLSYDFLRIPRV
jgi:hypothetical protein